MQEADVGTEVIIWQMREYTGSVNERVSNFHRKILAKLQNVSGLCFFL